MLASIIENVEFPRAFRLRQRFERPRVEEIAAHTRGQLESLQLNKSIRPGSSVAITAGSRGIANIVQILRTAVDHLHAIGAKPFIVPAMGSHGGATSEGQIGVLARYGITESSCNCPIRASMETEILCHSSQGVPVHADRFANQADHVLIVGRVKPHTGFAGPIESGLCKMMLIGLGKHIGARTYHAAFHSLDFATVLHDVVPGVIEELGVCGGLAIIENAYDETAHIEAVPPDAILQRESELLKRAKQWMPRLPFDDIDVLIIDEMGKNISGTGLDTNVVGRKFNDNRATADESPRVLRIVVRDLTERTHGNAAGIGLVDFIPRRLHEKIDFEQTWINGMTAGHIGGVKLPPVLENDRDAVAAALSTLGLAPTHEARLLWIKNTLDLAEVTASEIFYDDARKRDDLEVLGEPSELQI